MKRREFLAGVPVAASLARAGDAEAAPAGQAASIITIGRIHPRVEAAAGDLVESLRARDYAVERNPAAASSTRILIAVANQENRAKLSAAGRGSVELLAPERWPGGLRQIELREATMLPASHDGRQLDLPLALPVQAVTLTAGDASFRIRKYVEHLTVEAQR